VSVAPACELCGAPIEAGIRPRLTHLRDDHPDAARALWIRLAASWLFLALAAATIVFGWPVWVPPAGLFAGLVVNVAMRRRIVAARAGRRRPLPTLREFARGGGLGVLAVVLLILVLALLASR